MDWHTFAFCLSLGTLTSLPHDIPSVLHLLCSCSLGAEPWLECGQSGWVTVPQQKQRVKRPNTQRQHSRSNSGSGRRLQSIHPHSSSRKAVADEGQMAQQRHQQYSTPFPQPKRLISTQAPSRPSASPPAAHPRLPHTCGQMLADPNDSTGGTTPPSMLSAAGKHKETSRRSSLLPHALKISSARTAPFPASAPPSASHTPRYSRGRYLGTTSLSPQLGPNPPSTPAEHSSLRPTQSLQAASALAALAGPDTYITVSAEPNISLPARAGLMGLIPSTQGLPRDY
eukprot:1157736-Pelagomonas_calceolata.AAC.6